MKEYFTLTILIASVVLATPQLLITTMITITASSPAAYGQQQESNGGLTAALNGDSFTREIQLQLAVVLKNENQVPMWE